jgi:hypothetical protein
MVEQIGAFANDRIAIVSDRLEEHFDRFLGEFFRHLGAAGVQQPRGAGRRWVRRPGGQHGDIEAFERITHRAQHSEIE